MLRNYLKIIERGTEMLDPNKYIDRLRVIIMDKDWDIRYRIKDLIKDYDKEIDKTMEEMEREVLEMKKLKKNV